MYRWYERAEVCYAYLQDVPLVEIERSAWFTRGWTLQELLAPKGLSVQSLLAQKTLSRVANMVPADWCIVVHFFDKDWNSLGNQHHLVDVIQKATGIREPVLTRFVKLHNCSIAESMSWAATRETKRDEDRVYSLFGIFQVSLPMVYGEGGEAAFQRLQQAILRTSEDDTLFAWTGIHHRYGGLLAPNLEAFKQGGIFRTRADGPFLKVLGSQATERSIGIRTKLIPLSPSTYLVLLGCRHVSLDGGFGIYVRELGEDDDFARIKVSDDDLLYLSPREMDELQVLGRQNVLTPYKQDCPKTWAADRSITIRQLPLSWKHQLYLKKQVYGFRLDIPAESFSPYRVKGPVELDGAVSSGDTASTVWIERKKMMSAPCGTFLDKGIIGSVRGLYHPVTREKISEIRDIYVGFDQLFNPLLYIRKQSTAQTNTNIDAFLSERDDLEQETSYGCQSAHDSLLPQNEEAVTLEEAQFWNKVDAHTIVDHADREFCAIKTDRRAESEIYSYWLSDTKTRLNFRLRRYEMQEGMIWDLSLPAPLNVGEYKSDAGSHFGESLAIVDNSVD